MTRCPPQIARPHEPAWPVLVALGLAFDLMAFCNCVCAVNEITQGEEEAIKRMCDTKHTLSYDKVGHLPFMLTY